MKKLIVNLISGWSATIVGAVLGLLLIPFLIKEMGGSYLLVISLTALVGICQLVDLGIGDSLTRELSASLADKSQKSIAACLSSGLALYLSVALARTIIVLIAVPLILIRLKEHIELGDRPGLFYASLVFGLSYAIITALSQTTKCYLAAHQRYDLSNLWSSITAIGIAIALLLWIPASGTKIITWAYIHLVAQITLVIVLYASATKMEIRQYLGLGHISKGELKDLLGFSGKISLLKFTSLLGEKADPLILTVFQPFNLIIYDPALKVTNNTRPFMTTITSQLCPNATEAFVNGKNEEIQNILLSGTKYTMMIGGLIFTAIVLFSSAFTELWLGSSLPNRWGEVADLIIAVSIIELVTFSAGGTQWTVLYGMKKINFLIWTIFPTAVLNFVMSLLLVKYSSLGVYGVIISTFVIAIIRRPVMIWYVSRLLDISPWNYLRNSYFPPIALIALTLLFFFPFHGWMQSLSWSKLIACGMLLFVTYVAIAFFVVLDQSEKKLLLSMKDKIRQLLFG